MLLRINEIDEHPSLARINELAVSVAESKSNVKPLSDVHNPAPRINDNIETPTKPRIGMRRFFQQLGKSESHVAQPFSASGAHSKKPSQFPGRRRRFRSIPVLKQGQTPYDNPQDTGELTFRSSQSVGCRSTADLNRNKAEPLGAVNKRKNEETSGSNSKLSNDHESRTKDFEYGHPLNPHVVIHSVPLTKKVVKDVNRHWSRINMANEIADGICNNGSASSVSSVQSSSSSSSATLSPRSLSLHHNQCNRDPKALQELLQSFSKEGKRGSRKKLPVLLRRKAKSATQETSSESSLKAFSLCWNGIGTSAPVLEMVAKQLAPLSPQLEELKLCGNPLGMGNQMNGGFESLFRIGRLHIIQNVHLSDCDLGSNSKNGYRPLRILAKYLADPWAKIQSLNVKMNGIDSRGAKILAQGIAKNTSLKALNLDCNSIQQEGVNAILDAMIRNPNSALEELSICANLLGAQCVRVIGQKLHQTRLKILRLNHNDLGDHGVELLIPALSIRDGINKYGGSRLEELHLCSNNLSNKSILALSHTILSNGFLKKLFLTGNPAITRRSVSTFVDMLQGRNATLIQVEVLEDTYDNHLILDKLDYLCQTNRFSATIASGTIPESLWPHMLAKAKRADVLFFLLQHKPDLFGHYLCPHVQS